MTKRNSLINIIFSLIITISCVVIVALIANENYKTNMGSVLSCFLLGALVSFIICTIVHELGHYISGKHNGFKCISISILFLKFTKENGKLYIQFIKPDEEAGSTESVPKDFENLEKRLIKMTMGGLKASLICLIIGIIPLFFVDKLSLVVFFLFATFLPMGSYFFFYNALPISENGARNDGAVIKGLKREDDESKVLLSLLKIHALMYQGNTPSEIDKNIYFDLPQIQEDSLNFIMLLNARYNYYVDLKDFENAKKVSDRLLTLKDYMPKPVYNCVLTDVLYNVCTFDFNENLADDFMYELDKYLNSINNATNVRVKLAYILNITHDYQNFDMFYEKGKNEALECKIKGQGLYELKLLDRLKEDFYKNSKKEATD